MNYEGLKDDVISMLAGERCKVNPKGFKNDLTKINTRDDVLTVLIHLGYLSYDRVRKECYIPNLEVLGEMENAIVDVKWRNVASAITHRRWPNTRATFFLLPLASTRRQRCTSARLRNLGRSHDADDR